MRKFAIIGANGQVGCEVAFVLSNQPGVDVTAFVRSEYSSFLLRRAGINTVAVNFGDARKGIAHLGEFDLVADFSFPSGDLPGFRKKILSHVESIVGQMRHGASYVHMSSLMAFGMPNDSKTIEYHLIPRTSYAVIKRFTEKVVSFVSDKKGISHHCLRLGEVHGIFQNSTQELYELLSNEKLIINESANAKTMVVFASSVAHALIGIANGSVKPGVSVLVSNPQWTVSEVLEFYHSRFQSRCQIEFCCGNRARQSVWKDLQHNVFRLLSPYRGLIDAHILMNSAKLFEAVKGRYRSVISDAVTPMLVLPTKSFMVGSAGMNLHTSIQSEPGQVRLELDRTEDKLNYCLKI